jgi:hypothetical protein
VTNNTLTFLFALREHVESIKRDYGLLILEPKNGVTREAHIKVVNLLLKEAITLKSQERPKECSRKEELVLVIK